MIAENINWNMQQITKLDQYVGHFSMISIILNTGPKIFISNIKENNVLILISTETAQHLIERSPNYLSTWNKMNPIASVTFNVKDDAININARGGKRWLMVLSFFFFFCILATVLYEFLAAVQRNHRRGPPDKEGWKWYITLHSCIIINVNKKIIDYVTSDLDCLVNFSPLVCSCW